MREVEIEDFERLLSSCVSSVVYRAARVLLRSDLTVQKLRGR